MEYLVLYIFFIASLSAYRPSKYWPADIAGLNWLGGIGKSAVGAGAGILLLCIHQGLASGLLTALAMLMLVFSALIFFVNCKPVLRWSAFVLFHIACFIGIIIKF